MHTLRVYYKPLHTLTEAGAGKSRQFVRASGMAGEMPIGLSKWEVKNDSERMIS